MIGLIVFVCFIIFGFGGFYLGKQSSKSQLPINEKQNQVATNLEASVLNPIVNKYEITEPITNCISTYSSKYLKLNFKYDSCAWKINEELILQETGIYSRIIAKHDSGYQMAINANTMGMGGNYPGCYFIDNVSLINNDIARVHLISKDLSDNTQKYCRYLNSNNDYAIKGYVGNFGDIKFEEYFTFLKRDSFPNTNMCWRESGINPVSVLQPREEAKEIYEINKDIVVSIEEESITDKQFLMDADTLAVSVYTGIVE